MDSRSGLIPQTGSVLGIDYGTRRTGLARSDPERRIAFGLPTIVGPRGGSLFARHAPHPLLAERLRVLIEVEGATGVVLGLPRHEDGTPGRLAASVLALGAWIAGTFHRPVVYVDEFGTSRDAEERLRVAPRRRRRDKPTIDRMAAQLLLQEFLDAGAPFPQGTPPGGAA